VDSSEYHSHLSRDTEKDHVKPNR